MRAQFGWTSWPTILACIFGVSVLLFGLDILLDLAGYQDHVSAMRVALGSFRTMLDDSWRPTFAALKMIDGPEGDRLYQALFFEQSTKFQYPPASLLYLKPLQGLTEDPGLLLNRLNLVFYLAQAGVVAKIADVAALRSRFYDKGGPNLRAAVVLIAFCAAIIFYPTAKAAKIGQIQVWLDLAFAVSVLCWLFGRKGIAGALLGFACTIKPQFGLFLVWGLLWRDWRFVGGYLAVVVPVGLLSLAVFGIKNHLDYLQVLGFITERGETYFPNNSINGIVNRLLFNGSLDWSYTEFAPPNAVVYWSTRLAFLAFLAVGLKRALFREGGRPSVFDLGVVMLCAVMASPVAWEHHYGVAMPLFVLAFFAVYRGNVVSPALAIGLWVSWTLAANFTQLIVGLGPTYFNILQAHLFFGCLWLVWFLTTQHGQAGAWIEPGETVHAAGAGTFSKAGDAA